MTGAVIPSADLVLCQAVPFGRCL